MICCFVFWFAHSFSFFSGMAYAQFVQDGWWWKIEHLLVVSSKYKMYLVKDGKETTSE